MKEIVTDYDTLLGKRTMLAISSLRSVSSSGKRQKISSQLFSNISFRLLCLSSHVGGVIGRFGSGIKQLKLETGSLIRIEDAPSSCSNRVISITAPSGEGTELSIAQLALLRVFDRVLEVAAENDRNTTVKDDGLVTCRMLAEGNHVGAVIGKGGKVIETIRKDCGVKIRVVSTNLPVCVGPTEEVIEIDGDVSDVMKALAAVSGLLQDQLNDWKRMEVIAGKSIPVYPQVRLPEACASQYHLVHPLPSRSFTFTRGASPLLLDSDEYAKLDHKTLQIEVVFRFLCSKDKVGAVIGKGGSIIKAIQNQTEASVTIGPTLSECDDRLITIRAQENPKVSHSPAQNAVILIFLRTVKGFTDKDLSSCSNTGSSVSAKFVVSSSQVGCLLGRGGTVVSEMRKATGAGIQILCEVPCCAPEAYQLVQISGDAMHVKNAIYNVTSKLRDNMFTQTLGNLETRNIQYILNETSSLGAVQNSVRVKSMLQHPYQVGSTLREPSREPLRYPLIHTFPGSRRNSHKEDTIAYKKSFSKVIMDGNPNYFSTAFDNRSGADIHSTVTHDLDDAGFSSSVDRHSAHFGPLTDLDVLKLRGTYAGGRGSTPVRGRIDHRSGSKAAIVTNTTTEIIIPRNMLGAFYGENGNNLTLLRQISGAKVIVHELCLGTHMTGLSSYLEHPMKPKQLKASFRLFF